MKKKMKQRSDEWHKYRGPRITASRFGDVIARPDTKRYLGYMEDIANSIIGVPRFDDEDKPWFQHGKEWEDDARKLAEWENGIEISTDNTVIQHAEYEFISCSPDGTVLPKAGVEIKSHKSKKEFDVSKKKMPAVHVPQVQGCLWIAMSQYPDMEYWLFVSYYRNMHTQKEDILSHKIYPDLKYHKRLESACLTFYEKIKEITDGRSK